MSPNSAMRMLSRSAAFGTKAGTVLGVETVHDIEPAAVHENAAVPNIIVLSLELYSLQFPCLSLAGTPSHWTCHPRQPGPRSLPTERPQHQRQCRATTEG